MILGGFSKRREFNCICKDLDLTLFLDFVLIRWIIGVSAGVGSFLLIGVILVGLVLHR